MDGTTNLKVSMWKPAKKEEPVKTIQVNDVPKGAIEMMLRMFFESEKYCQGGDVEKVEFTDERTALITFKELHGNTSICFHITLVFIDL